MAIYQKYMELSKYKSITYEKSENDTVKYL